VLTGYGRLTQTIRERSSAGRQDEPKLTDAVIYTKRGSPILSHGNCCHDKTVTARHREISDREDGRSECPAVMARIVIE